MTLAFIDRDPTAYEIEYLRLLLSTYQDGSGQQVSKRDPDKTLPGWRDFERATALTFGGEAQESKFIFDVLLTDPSKPEVRYGISCKMRSELDRIDKKDGRVTLELSNSAGKFWDALRNYGITEANYKNKPEEAGRAIIELVSNWHKVSSLNTTFTRTIDFSKSLYLTLSWNWGGWYQLHKFPLTLPNPQELTWEFPLKNTKGGIAILSKRLRAKDKTGGIIFEWYGTSGAQLKYYPLATSATWHSERFRLEPVPPEHQVGIKAKITKYFPKAWSDLQALKE